jgi:hypothetical protein
MTMELLKGQPLLKACKSYADVFNIHFGKPTSYKVPKLAHLFRGEFVVSVVLSSLYWTRPDGEVVRLINDVSPSEEYDRVGDMITALKDAAIEEVSRSDAHLSLKLDSGDVFDIPNARDEDVPGWEVIGPGGFYCRE